MIHTHGFSQWLSAGIICLLVGGTLAAKAVFLVDNELEHKAELNSENGISILTLPKQQQGESRNLPITTSTG